MHHMETSRISFEAFLLTAFDQGDYSTDDAIAFVLPLCRKVLGFHEAGLVAPFERADALFLRGRILDMDEALAHAPAVALYRVEALFPRPQSQPFEVVDTIRLRTDAGEGTTKTEDRRYS
jgi:hypothetical protein